MTRLDNPDPESPENVAARVARTVAEGHAITYTRDHRDKEHPELLWGIWGLYETNEIAVVASVGNLKLGATRPSALVHPHMVDRIFGMDYMDANLAEWLSEQLWEAFTPRLLAEIRRVRELK